MPDITILTETDLRGIISLDNDAVDCIESAFRLLATTDVVMPPILSFNIPDHNGEIDVKSAYVPGIDGFAIKMSSGFFDNPGMGLPSLSGLMVLFSAQTGLVQALLLDNGYLTDIRTAAAGAVAAKHLSRPDSKVAGIIGTGLQARLQLRALTLVRDIGQAVIWGRDPDQAAACAQDCARDLGIQVTTATDIARATANADIIVTTTPATAGLITASMLKPGQHVTAMGSDTDYKCELAPDVIPAATLFVCDRRDQSARLGELRTALAAGTVGDAAAFPELGEIIAGQATGRTAPSDITICDLTGTGVQDTAIATLARRRADATGAGTSIHT